MEYQIPLFDLNFGEEEEQAVLRTLRSRWISMGPNVKTLESRFSLLLGGTNAVAVNSCTAALHLALKVLDIGPGDEVVVPSLTFVATVNAVRYVGANPVFADIVGPEDISLDAEDFLRRITPQTKAVIVMHYGGFSVNLDRFMEIARSRGIAVIEDTAHAPGADFNGRPLGSIGDVGCFSFFSNKNITCAEGGMLVTGNDDHAARARLLRAHGMTSLSYERAKGHANSYDVVDIGYNYRLDDIRGALILAQLDKLAADLERRAQVRQWYLAGLAGVEGIHVPYREHRHISSNYIMPVVLTDGGAERRDKVREKLAALGVQTSVHYPAVHQFSVYSRFASSLPHTEHLAAHEITLPMYPALTADQVDQVCRGLQECL